MFANADRVRRACSLAGVERVGVGEEGCRGTREEQECVWQGGGREGGKIDKRMNYWVIGIHFM